MNLDPEVVAKTHDMIQYLFYFVCVLAFTIFSMAAWFAKYILLPARDRHFTFLDAQIAFMNAVASMLKEMYLGDNARQKMHEQNLKKLSELYRVCALIYTRIRGETHASPVRPSEGGQGSHVL